MPLRFLLIASFLICTAIGCAGAPSNIAVAEPVPLQPAVWAPKRIYAPLDVLSRTSAESILRAEAVKECGGALESRSFVVQQPAAEPGLLGSEMLAIEYVCLESGVSQSVDVVEPLVSPAALQQ